MAYSKSAGGNIIKSNFKTKNNMTTIGNIYLELELWGNDLVYNN
jgi:hypothetical protein